MSLKGLCLWCTRPGCPGEKSARRFGSLGARVLLAPTLTITPVLPSDTALAEARAAALDSLVALTSPTAAAGFLKAMGELRPDGSVWAAVAVGEATAARASDLGMQVVATAPRATAVDLGPVVLDVARGRPVLLPGSNLQRPGLAETLRSRGCKVVELVVQCTEPMDALPDAVVEALDSGELDLVVAYSPSALEVLGRAAGRRFPAVAALGPTTAKRARELGLEVVAEPSSPGEDALVAAVVEWWAARA